MELIDKATVVAEIKRRKQLVSDPILSGDDLMIGERNALFNLLSFLNTLEVKEVNDDKWFIKATEWLSANLHRYDESIGLSVEEFVERFKKAVGK